MGPLSPVPVSKLRDLSSPSFPQLTPVWSHWYCGDGGGSKVQRHGARAEDPGLCPVLGAGWGAWVAPPNPEWGLLSFFPGSVLGFALCLSLPSVGKGQQSCPCAGMLGSSGAPHPCIPSSLRQGDSLFPEPPASASSSSFQPERIKEGSEKINKHAGKTQTD